MLCGVSLVAFTRRIEEPIEPVNDCRDSCEDKYDEKMAYCNTLRSARSQFRDCKNDAKAERTECKAECNER
jgi:hypothetical protein